MSGSGMSQVIESVVDSSAVTIATAPAAAMAMTYQAMADSLGLAMANAVAAQQHGQVIGQAALAQVLAMIISKGVKGK